MPPIGWYLDALCLPDELPLTWSHTPATSSFSLRGPRPQNQDRTFIGWMGRCLDQPPMLVVGLLDGMGGMKAGDVAASVAAAHFLSALVKDRRHIEVALRSAISLANMAVFELFEGHGGATLTAVAMTDDRCVAIHVGDSRLYRSAPRFEQVSTDDNLAGLLGVGNFDPFDSGLLQFVGIGPSILCQSYDLTDAVPSSLLITSDGLHSLGPTFLRSLLRGGWSETRLQRIEIDRGLDDNASAALVRTARARVELSRLSPNELHLTCGFNGASFTINTRGD